MNAAHTQMAWADTTMMLALGFGTAMAVICVMMVEMSRKHAPQCGSRS